MLQLVSTKGDLHGVMLQLIELANSVAPNDPEVGRLVARYNAWYTSRTPGGEIIYPPFWHQLSEMDPYWTIGTTDEVVDIPELDWYLSHTKVWAATPKVLDVMSKPKDVQDQARRDLHYRLRLMDRNMSIESISRLYGMPPFRMGKYIAGMYLRDDVMNLINALTAGKHTNSGTRPSGTSDTGGITYKLGRVTGGLFSKLVNRIEKGLDDAIQGIEDGYKNNGGK